MAGYSKNNTEQAEVLDIFESYRNEKYCANLFWRNASREVVLTVDADLIKHDMEYMFSYNRKNRTILLFPAGSQPFNVHACKVNSIKVCDSVAFISIAEDHILSELRLFFPIRWLPHGKRYKMHPINDHDGIVQFDVGSIAAKASDNLGRFIAASALLALLLIICALV